MSVITSFINARLLIQRSQQPDNNRVGTITMETANMRRTRKEEDTNRHALATTIKEAKEAKIKSEIDTVDQEVGLKGASFISILLFPDFRSLPPLCGGPSPPAGGARAPPRFGCAGFTGSIVTLVPSITCCPLALRNFSARWLKSTKVD